MARIELSTGTAAEIVHPQTGTPKAGIVLIPDIMGLRPLFEEHCARISKEWKVSVCAPEPFPGGDKWSLDQRMKKLKTYDDEDKVGDILAAAQRTGCDNVHVIGFCMGGMYALKAAGTGRFDRAVAFYGMIRVPDDWRGPGQRDALDTAVQVCPTLAVFGGKDPWTPAADIEALRAAWRDRDDCEIVVYPDADHGFVHAPERPAHRPDDARDAWQRALAFLRR
jgi:carboxymethylenebutenolidase